jgi:hypothetical protein
VVDKELDLDLGTKGMSAVDVMLEAMVKILTKRFARDDSRMFWGIGVVGGGLG